MVATEAEDRRAVAEAVSGLARWATDLRWGDVPPQTRKRLGTVVFDVLAANILGATTPAQGAARGAWPRPSGHSPLVGGGACTDAATAAFLNGQATVCLEPDEGHKQAKGHPAAHVFPAVLALAAEQDVTGVGLGRALLVGYEVAARFGRASRLRPGTHPHGNWGVAGAAAGCAALLGLDAEHIAAAIDAGSAMPIAGHFETALEGNPVRDAWIGVANTAGLAAARLAAAGLAHNTGSAAASLGELLGDFDPAALTDDLGDRYAIEGNYFKRHASCSYTHPVADLALQARDALCDPEATPVTVAEQVTTVQVTTHRLAAGLNRTRWQTPLAAMFSVPFVTAAALAEGKVSPAASTVPSSKAPLLASLAGRVEVCEDEQLTRLLPTRRAARVTVSLSDGRSHTGQAPNPVGDADFAPFDRDELATIFADLLGEHAHALHTVDAVAEALATAPSARTLLAPLAESPVKPRTEES